MFGILNSTLRVASRSDTADTNQPRRTANAKADARLAKVRFRTAQDAADWARKL